MNQMSFSEFCKEVKREIPVFLPEEYKGADIAVEDVLKNNNLTQRALLIKKPGSMMCPMIYMHPYYERYLDTDDMTKVVTDIVELRMSEEKENQMLNDEALYDYDKCREKIMPRLINTKFNVDMLQNVPHKEMEDLSVIYTVELGEREDEVMSMPVTNELIDSWEKTKEDVEQAAEDNLKMRHSYTLEPITKVLDMEQQEAENDEIIYVLSNERKMYGATEIINPEAIETLMKKTDEKKFYLLPSSIHEFLVVLTNDITTDDLRQMVREVNDSVVKREEILSYNVYTYTRENGLKVVS